MRALFTGFLGLFLAVCTVAVQAAPTVYTGYDVSFSKEALADPTAPANQDMITPSVKITRGSTSGLFNAASESFYVFGSSPAGTEWAFPHNNAGATLTATAWETLNFADWVTAMGGGGSASAGPPSTIGQDAVLHLIEDDIYLDIRFTDWGVGSGGGGAFSYMRSVLGSSTSADFNDDGIVDGEDFLIWQRGFGTGTTLGEGDADGDGDVDADDLTEWQSSYGGSLSANATAVPEPAGLTFALLALLGFSCRGRSRR